MPALITKIEGRGNGIKTRVLNLGEVARHLRVSPQYPLKYWGYELGAPTEFKAGEEKYMLNGSFATNVLQEFLDKFIDKFVLCGRCKYPEIIIQVKKGKLWADCAACGANILMDNSHKLCSFIIKNPPAGEPKAKSTKGKKGGIAKVESEEDKKDPEPVSEVTIDSPEVLEVIERLQTAQKTPEELSEQIKSTCISQGFSHDLRLYLLIAGVFGRNICSILRDNKDLSRLLRREARHHIPELLSAFAAVYVPLPEFHKFISTCFKLMLDSKVLTETDFREWKNDSVEFSDSSVVYNPEQVQKLKELGRDFLDWLDTAEEDEGCVEEEDEEVKDTEAVLRQKQLIQEHLAAQSKSASSDPPSIKPSLAQSEPPEGGPPLPAQPPLQDPQTRVDLVSIVNQQDDDLNIDDI